MLTLLGRLLIKDSGRTDDPEVRTKWGTLCSVMGILLNLIIVAGKAWAGLMSGSIAIAADAANNISDALSSVISLAGFRMARQKPDREHPFGHARIEYLSGMIVSVMILIMGFELLKESFGKILHPEKVTGNVLILVILAVSILVKFYMFCYNRAVGKKIGSTALLATAGDSRNDSITTSFVLLSSVITTFTGKNLDGWFGLGVSVFIMISGIGTLIDTANPLLGDMPDPDFVRKVEEIVLGYKPRGILEMHDLIVHDYGPGHRMITLHVEVPSSGTLMKTHALVDEIEHRLREELSCEAVIHIDPVNIKDPETISLDRLVRKMEKELPGEVEYHDFRTYREHGKLKIMFDVVVPYGYSMTDQEIIEYFSEKLEKKKPGSVLDIEVDKK